jgi:16S rRNA (cytosine1402-N4)-methyltransferase
MSHIPVMLPEVLAALAPAAGATVLDGTFGGGGYAAAILDAAPCTVWAMDRDPDAIARGAALAARYPGRLHLIQGRFGEMAQHLAERGVTALDGVVLDLGVSSFQIDEAERGFSFRADGPLDMRMEREGPSAADLVNTLPSASWPTSCFISARNASRAASPAISWRRAPSAHRNHLRLVEIIRRSVPRDPSGLHPATRSFQALRIRVNDELGEIERALAAGIALLAPGGRIVVVSFHSLEDRLVKRAFQAAAGRAPGASRHDPRMLQGPAAPTGFRLLTPRSVRPSDAECAGNPRARSAHLRALQRLPESRAA